MSMKMMNHRKTSVKGPMHCMKGQSTPCFDKAKMMMKGHNKHGGKKY